MLTDDHHGSYPVLQYSDSWHITHVYEPHLPSRAMQVYDQSQDRKAAEPETLLLRTVQRQQMNLNLLQVLSQKQV